MLGIAPTFTTPSVYLFSATAVYSVSFGVIVAAAYVLNCKLLDPLTLTVPAVPLEI